MALSSSCVIGVGCEEQISLPQVLFQLLTLREVHDRNTRSWREPADYRAQVQA